MHLRSISMKGFKSFPDRTKLEFAPGVSVIVGPNGSGKSNITDAVLWALGEQSPLAVRGQTMKDVIFAGGHGVQGSQRRRGRGRHRQLRRPPRRDFSEISIVRRLDRDGEGEYRLNGARCRLVDVIEVLSDSGLGKEMHSVVSQGKVEADRAVAPARAAAADRGGRRARQAPQAPPARAAQARAHRGQPRPRARRRARGALAAAAAQAPGRGGRAARAPRAPDARGALALARDAAREARARLAARRGAARAARAAERDEAERLLGEVAARREQAEQAFAEQTPRARGASRRGLFAARSAADRIAHAPGARPRAGPGRAGAPRAAARELELLEAEAARDAAGEADPLPDERLPRPPEEDGGSTRAAWDALAPATAIRSLEREIGRLETDRQARLREEVASLEAELERARGEHARLQEAAPSARPRSTRPRPRSSAPAARAATPSAPSRPPAPRAAQAGAELAAVNQFLRTAARGAGRRRSRWRRRSTSRPATSWRWPPRSARACPPPGGRPRRRRARCSTTGDDGGGT